MPENILFSYQTNLPEEHLLDPAQQPFQTDRELPVDRLWNGELPAIDGRPPVMTVASLWNDEALFLYFAATFTRLNVNPAFGVGGPCDQLWEFDVVEAFIRPAGADGYFEFEVSPLNQWLDLHVLEPRRSVDWDWRSQLKSATLVREDEGLWLTALRIPFEPMLKKEAQADRPRPGSTWRLNLFRAAGSEPGRLYFCWRPTLTPDPDFHVPRAFGTLLFMNEELLSS